MERYSDLTVLYYNLTRTRAVNTKSVHQLVSILHERLNIDPYLFDIHIKCCYNLLVQVPPIDIVDDEDLNFFLEGSDASRMLLFVLVTPVKSME